MKLYNLNEKKYEEIKEDDAMFSRIFGKKIYGYADGNYVFINDERTKVSENILNFLNMVEKKEIEIYEERDGYTFENEDGEEKFFKTREMFKNAERRWGDVCNFQEMKTWVENQ